MKELGTLSISAPREFFNDHNVKVWARSVDAFVPKNRGGYSISGPWLRTDVAIEEKIDTAKVYSPIFSSSTRSNMVIVCAALGSGPGSFRVVFILAPDRPPGRHKTSFDFTMGGMAANATMEAKNCAVMHMGCDELTSHVGIVAHNFQIELGYVIPAQADAYDTLKKRLDASGVTPDEFFSNCRNGVYYAAAVIATWSMNGLLSNPIDIKRDDDPEEAVKAVEQQPVKPRKKSKYKNFIYAGSGTKRRKLKLPNGYMYLGSRMGLKMFARHGNPDDAFPAYKMLDRLVAAPAKDLPEWVTVMQEEIEKMENIIGATRVSIIALKGKKQ
jgi:hypothetical protein